MTGHPNRTSEPDLKPDPIRNPTNVDNERTDGEGQDVDLSGSFAERAREGDERSAAVEPNLASSAGICPTCSTSQLVVDGLIARHKGTVMRWSGRRWFRDTCAGSSLVGVVAEEVRHG